MFTQLQSWLNETLTAGKKARRVDRDGRRFRPSLTVLEDRTVPSTIVWANRDLPDNQGGSGFNAFFGADAERAKGVVDAALHAWEKVIQSFNFPLEPRVFISMGSDAGFGASASERTYFGHPVEGTITINRGGAGPDGGWFLDPTPLYSEEFRGDLATGEGMGNIVNPYVSAPTKGGPASREMGIGGDLYSVVVLEMTHVLGIASNGGLLFTQDPQHYFNIVGNDSLDTPGHLVAFRSPHVDALLTTNNGGPGGEDKGTPVHIARPGPENMLQINGNGYFRGVYYGANDSGNASGDLTFRRQPSYLDALILGDVYGYTLHAPTDNSTYVNFDPSTGNLLVRGGSFIDPIYSSAASNDEITLRRVDIANVRYVAVDVKIGSAIRGTGPNPVYQNLIPLSMVRSITVKGGDGADTIKIGDGDIYFLPPITVDGGSGKDSIIVDNHSDFAAYTYTVTNSKIARNIGFGGLTYSNAETLTLITEATTTAPLTTVNVESTDAATPVTITGSGNSIVNVGKNGSVYSIRGNLIINPTGKAALNVDASNGLGETFRIADTGISGLAPALISYGADQLSSLTVSAGSGFRGNTITVRSTPTAPVILNTGFNDDVVDIRITLGPLTVNGQSGADTVHIGRNGSVRGITGQLTVTNAGNYSAVDVDDSGDRGARTAIVYTNRPSEGSYTVISGLIQSGDILLKGRDLSSLTIRAGDAGNVFRIHDTPISAISGGVTTTVITGDGNDQVTVDGTTGALVLNVQQGNNQINFGSGNASLDAIQGAIRLVGVGGTNAVRIDDRLSTTNRILTHTISAPSFTRGSVPTYARTGAASIQMNNVSSFDLMAGSAADTINVQGRPASSKGIADFTIEGGPGNDIFNIGNDANQLVGIGTVLLDGQSGVDVLNLLDQGTTTPAVYAFSLNFGVAPQFGGGDATLLYGNIENQSLFGGSGGNTITVSGIKLSPYSGGNLATIHSGTGDDVVTVGSTLDGINSPLSIDGQSGDDRLILNDSKAKTGQTYDVLQGSFSRTNSARISFGALEHLDVTGTPFDDSFRIGDATHALDGLLPEITLNGNGGVNTLDYSAYPAGGSALSIPGIVSWYKGEGTADDAVGANNGTLVNGATFAPGMVGQAFSFDGIDDYVDLGNAASLDIPGSLTIEAWVNYTTLDSYKYLVADFTGGGTSQGSIGILDNSHFFWYQSMTDGSSIQVEGAMPLVAGQWYHVAAVRDDVAKTITLYVNGVEDGRASYAGTAVALQQTKVVGTSQPVGFPGDFFHGRIDEPSIYSRPLTAAEIKSISDAGSAGKSGGSSEGVTVNLTLGTATGISGGVTNFRNVNGSAGNDILTGGKLGGVLMGGAGNDILTGGGGRNILVGGSGLDTLFGNRFGDILIGGQLSYYDEAAHRVDQVAVNALLAEWSRTDLGYQDRVDHLNGTVAGGLNGFYLLNSSTIFDDGFLDGIFVGPGQNWLLNS